MLIKIDLGGENYANIAAFKNSNPLDLATKFCRDYQLPDTIIEPLCYRIRTNVRSHFTKIDPVSNLDNNLKMVGA